MLLFPELLIFFVLKQLQAGAFALIKMYSAPTFGY